MSSKPSVRRFNISITNCCGNKFFVLCILLATCLSYSMASSPQYQITPQECTSLDIRNDCENFKLLENCTVIKGFLMITLTRTHDSYKACNYTDLRFPLLREVTDFVIFHFVRGLTTIRDMFPNLTVIRGRRLITNYALSITHMPDLEMVEFKSLVAIQRGHVFIGSSAKLCQLERINWNRLTLTTGQNHIFPVAPEKCEEKSLCTGCDQPYCWSNKYCQKFENDNVLLYKHDTKHCHVECLGGCTNSTNAGCVVCRRLTDHGLCVKECPADKFLHEHFQRCYTREECVDQMGLLTYQKSCVTNCPSDYKPDNNGACIPCSTNESCDNICQPKAYLDNSFIIDSLAEADKMTGCRIINGTLIIKLKNKINENDLVQSLGEIRDIKGYLKIYRSPYLTSLRFLTNLQKVEGNVLDEDDYSLVIYNNKNLKELWKPQNFELKRGGMLINVNNKLCNNLIQDFSDEVLHDRKKDMIYSSDQKLICGPVKLRMTIEVISHNQLLVTWPKYDTLDKVEIIFRPVSETERFNEDSELDKPICESTNWHSKLLFKTDLIDYGTDFSYLITGLKQNTKYACLVKTFGADYKQNARSDLIFITTKADVPPPLTIEIIEKTNSSLTINLEQKNPSLNNMDSYYLVEVFEKPDDVSYLDKRDYCRQPADLSKSVIAESYSINNNDDDDYDGCCDHLEDVDEKKKFLTDMRNEFSCSMDRKEMCSSPYANTRVVYNFALSINEPIYTLRDLNPFRLYIIRAKACNRIGCSSPSFSVSERTNFMMANDLVKDIVGCKTPDNNEYRVFFTEPKLPNGAIVSYMVYFREFIPNAKEFPSDVRCITRLEHQQANNILIDQMSSKFNQVAVRSFSLAGDVITDWHDITSCDLTSSILK